MFGIVHRFRRTVVTFLMSKSKSKFAARSDALRFDNIQRFRFFPPTADRLINCRSQIHASLPFSYEHDLPNVVLCTPVRTTYVHKILLYTRGPRLTVGNANSRDDVGECRRGHHFRFRDNHRTADGKSRTTNRSEVRPCRRTKTTQR